MSWTLLDMLLGGGMGLLGGGGAVGLAYDAYEDDLAHVYEPARRVLTSYTGNLCRLRRNSDDAEKDFGYDSSNDLDTAAISTWLGGATGYFVTVYDQIGDDDVTQSTTSRQPKYVANMQNGRPGMLLDGTNDYVVGAYTSSGSLSQPFMLLSVASLDASVVNDNSTACALLDGDDGTNRAAIVKHDTPNPDAWRIISASAVNGSAADSDWHVFSALYNGASSELWLDGTSDVTGDVGASAPDGITIGSSHLGTTGAWVGKIALPAIVVDANLSDTQRTGLESAINNYWSIY